MTVPTFHNGTNLAISLLNIQLPHSSNVTTIGIQTVQVAVLLMPAYFPSSPMCRIDLLSLVTTVLLTSQQGQTIMVAGRPKTGVKNSKGTAFCAVSQAIGRQNVHSIAGCNLYMHRFLSRTSRS